VRETQTSTAAAGTGADARPGAIPFGAGSAFRTLLASLSAKEAGFASLRGALARSPDRIASRPQSHAASRHHHSGNGAGGTANAAATGKAALAEAMQREGVPASWQASLQFIMAEESGGRVDVKNPTHSARGLFQLTAANYHYMPRGAGSFGNGVEEAQGGIRYIVSRYGTAANAASFWQQHQWY
jgi:hypothetical protein